MEKSKKKQVTSTIKIRLVGSPNAVLEFIDIMSNAFNTGEVVESYPARSPDDMRVYFELDVPGIELNNDS